MLYIKIQPQSFLKLWRRRVLHNYIGMAAILFNGTQPLDQIVNILSTEGPM